MSFEIGDIVKSMESHFNVRAIPLFGKIYAITGFGNSSVHPEYSVKWENGSCGLYYDYELAPVSVQEYDTAKKQEKEFIKSLKEGKYIAVAEPVDPVDIQPTKKPIYDALETLKDYYIEKIQQIEQMQKDIAGK